MEYIIVTIIGFALGYIYNNSGKDKLDIQIMSNLKAGKRVIICVDNDATLFEMNGDKIRITKAIADFNSEPVDLPVGVSYGRDKFVTDAMDSSGPDQSGNYNEAGLGN